MNPAFMPSLIERNGTKTFRKLELFPAKLGFFLFFKHLADRGSDGQTSLATTFQGALDYWLFGYEIYENMKNKKSTVLRACSVLDRK